MKTGKYGGTRTDRQNYTDRQTKVHGQIETSTQTDRSTYGQSEPASKIKGKGVKKENSAIYNINEINK